MASLAEALLHGEDKDLVVTDCVQLLEDYIAGRGGLKGIGMKAGVGMLKAAKPDILQRAAARFLPEFLAALDPFYREFGSSRSAGQGFDHFLAARSEAAAAALLGVADARIAASTNTLAKGTYQRFRGGAEKEVAAILPRLGSLIARYLPAA
jgi:hypothetical protein